MKNFKNPLKILILLMIFSIFFIPEIFSQGLPPLPPPPDPADGDCPECVPIGSGFIYVFLVGLAFGFYKIKKFYKKFNLNS